MVASAAVGKDHTQVLDSLGLSDVLDLHSASLRLMAIAAPPIHHMDSSNNCISAGPILSFVNSLWLDRRFRVNPSFKGIAEGIFRVETKDIDFVTQVSITY